MDPFDADLGAQLIALEKELHSNTRRSDSEFMETVLHPDFMEIGRSGRVYSRQDIVDAFKTGAALPAIDARDFHVSHIGEAVWLLTYRSSHIGDNGQRYRLSLRCSIWVRTDKGLQLRFHQGTPADEDKA